MLCPRLTAIIFSCVALNTRFACSVETFFCRSFSKKKRWQRRFFTENGTSMRLVSEIQMENSGWRRYRLRIDLEDFEGEKRYAEYSTFSISSSADNYRLTVGGYSGDAVTGQCTVSNCEVSDSRSEESLLKRLEEHDHIMRSAVDTKFQTMNETLSSAIDTINEKLNVILGNVYENIQYSRSQDNCPNNNQVVCDCSDIKVNGHTTSGVYRIYVVDGGQRYYANAYCDMTTENRGWTVFQRRKDGSVDFFREWSDYANGFGNPYGEFWLGNDFLYRLSSKRRYRLRIDLEDFEGGNRYAEYSTFNISSSADKYRLTIDNYSGTAGDSFSYNSGRRFTTKDNDNDANSSLNCAVDRHGAWWYDELHMVESERSISTRTLFVNEWYRNSMAGLAQRLVFIEGD